MFLARAEHVGCQGMEKCLRIKFGPMVNGNIIEILRQISKQAEEKGEKKYEP